MTTNNSVHPQGAIVIANDPFGNTPKRPYLVLSNDRVPFSDEESIVAAITTTDRSEAVELTSNRIVAGGLPRRSFVSPWTLLTIKHWMITKQPARATLTTVEDVHRALNEYLQTGLSSP